ncbi:MAG: hypothetical protein CMN30_19350 [Sandaracinus sp.]|nr:hypothetical protein [Sandaracinus sp.]
MGSEYEALLTGSVRPDPSSLTDPRALLCRALAATRAGRFTVARAALDRALERGGSNGAVRLVAAQLLYVTRDHGRALAMLRELGRTPGSLGDRARREAIDRAWPLGWAADVRELLDEAMAQNPGNLRWFVESARVHARARAWEPARRALEAAVAIEDGSATLWMELAGVAAEAGHRARALEAAERAIALGRGLPVLLEGARVAVLAGDLERAKGLLHRARSEDPADGRALRELAELALWRADGAAALRWVELLEGPEGFASEEEARDAERIRATVHLLAGRHAEALALVEGPGGDYRRPMVRAEALWRLGRTDEAHEALTQASMTAPGFLPTAWLLRLRSLFVVDVRFKRMPTDRFTEVRELLAGLVDDADAILASDDWDAVRDTLDTALERLAGNRSITPTRWQDGELSRLPPITGERFAARRALESIRSVAPDEALARLAEVGARFPGSALVEAHHGELLLWLRRYDEARATLEQSIATTARTRWPYIGLSALDLVEGDPEACLETNARGIRAMDDTVGAAVYVHRGEAYYRLGRLAEARADLEEALRIHPSRVTARILLILVRDAAGDRAGAEALWAELNQQAIGLLSDAAAARGVVLFDGPQLPPLSRARPVLEEAMRLFGANRSSTLMIYFAGERLRFAPHWPHAGRLPHDGDGDDLDRTEATLRSMLRLGGRRAPVVAAPTAPEPVDDLTRELRDHGHLTLCGAVPAALCERIRRSTLRRLRVAPEKVLKEFDAARDADAARAFDPADPATFWRQRIDVYGDASIDLATELPAVWAAVTAALGGAERVATSRIGENVILNLVPAPQWTDELPGPGFEGWHVDDPPERARLDSWRNGLVGLLLLDDVAPGAGATYLAADSVPVVARALAARPEGVDLTGFDIGAEWSRSCTRFVELHGAAGDVFLLHPLALHSASPNPSGKVRWLSNPMFYVREPLDFVHPRSPVEQVVAEVLGAG